MPDFIFHLRNLSQFIIRFSSIFNSYSRNKFKSKEKTFYIFIFFPTDCKKYAQRKISKAKDQITMTLDQLWHQNVPKVYHFSWDTILMDWDTVLSIQ